MLVRLLIKILFIPFMLTLFLSFKNNAKNLEKELVTNKDEVLISYEILDRKKSDFSLSIQSVLKPHKKKYDQANSIFIEKYLDDGMSLIRVYYDKKPN